MVGVLFFRLFASSAFHVAYLCLFVCSFRCCPVNCAVGQWGSWGSCDAKCEAAGKQIRKRTITTPPSCGGTACPTTQEQRACRGGCCKRDCLVSNWGSWGKCNAPPGKCGANSGSRGRSRTITRQPSCGGSACPSTSDNQRCTPVPITCQVRSSRCYLNLLTSHSNALYPVRTRTCSGFSRVVRRWKPKPSQALPHRTSKNSSHQSRTEGQSGV